jgi:hypothetical protein
MPCVNPTKNYGLGVDNANSRAWMWDDLGMYVSEKKLLSSSDGQVFEDERGKL